MVSQASTVCAALLANTTVAALIGTNIFNDMPPSEAAFPCLTYSESNSIALAADNAEALTGVIFQVECWVKGSAWPLAAAVNDAMQAIGYFRNSANDAGMAGVIHQVSMKFTTVKGV